MIEEGSAASSQTTNTDPVEAAGETTAAEMVSGPPDTRPVGASTLVEVEGHRAGGEGGEEK